MGTIPCSVGCLAAPRVSNPWMPVVYCKKKKKVRIIGFMLCVFHHNFKKERDSAACVPSPCPAPGISPREARPALWISETPLNSQNICSFFCLSPFTQGSVFANERISVEYQGTVNSGRASPSVQGQPRKRSGAFIPQASLPDP